MQCIYYIYYLRYMHYVGYRNSFVPLFELTCNRINIFYCGALVYDQALLLYIYAEYNNITLEHI